MIIKENPFTILVNGQEIVTLLCSPYKLEYLAAGFLLSEGLIRDSTLIKNVILGKNGHYADIELDKDFQVTQDFFQKRIISSGCGRGSSFNNPEDCKPLNSNIRITHKQVADLMKRFQEKSALFKKTGGVHSAALCNQNKIEIFAEDIGRHNAIDKIFGECFFKKIDTREKIILTTGRVSSEILIKIAKRAIPILISRSAPTDLAVGLAEGMNVTLVGFARGKRMNIYSHDVRIIQEEKNGECVASPIGDGSNTLKKNVIL
ncbi:MAG: formate dehydrogenase accessory sulfurtransferase FdhD [bacterium]